MDLVAAIEEGREHDVLEALRSDPAAFTRDELSSALFTAAFHQLSRVVDALLAAGADIDWVYPNWSRRTALLDAIEHGHVEMVHFLLARGASVAATDAGQAGVLHYAINHEWEDAGRHLGSDRPIDPSLTRALIEAGADVNLATPEGSSPLDVALELGHTAAAELIVRAGGVRATRGAARDRTGGER